MSTPEFIFLNDQAVKVTSLKESDDSVILVVIARGGADRDRTLELLSDPNLRVRFGQDDIRPMRASDTDVRSSGEGPQAIHRIQTTLAPPPEDQAMAADPLLDRLDRIIDLLTELRDRLPGDAHG
ncbi:MAG TPA: hypothetical protein VNZ55_08445 [Thermomicrobiales bacterium]|nr:hypothetical protein [Thermomicrobiales bacterium]